MGYQKPIATWRPARCQAARPYLPNAFRLQVKISCGIKNYQALLPCIRQAVKSCSRNDHNCALHLFGGTAKDSI